MAAVVAALPAQVQPGLQFAELGKRHLPEDSDETRAVAYGDVDGDGDLDMVIGNYDQQSRLYLNNGTGRFSDATAGRMPVGNYATTSMALGDVDGDNDLDLVMANAYGQQNRLYLNNGSGTFSDATATQMPVDSDWTWSVALGDVDGDGDRDLVIGNSWQNRLYLNNGSGTFTDATVSRMPVDSDITFSVALGDVDGDGDRDLVLGNGGFSGQQNRLYLNNGSGTFSDATASRMPVDSDHTGSVALGDVDGDGDRDLVIGNDGQNRLYLNNGSGTFTDVTASRMPVVNDRTNSVALGDVDGDGHLDVVIGNLQQQNRLYRNNGAGTFTDVTAIRMPANSDSTSSVTLGDVDGDGDLDMAIGNWWQQNRLHLNNGTGAFTEAAASPMPVDSDWTLSAVLVDADSDGAADIVFGNGGQNRLYLNNGTGTFKDATTSRMPVDSDSTNAVAVGDVDGDGDLDLVCGNGYYAVGEQNRLYLNNGTGTFTDVTASRLPVNLDSTRSVALGDVDGDGDLDLVVGNSYWQQNRLYLNNGTGTFLDATASRMPPDNDYTTSVALGDVDGDGDLDLVIGNSNQQNRLYLNNGTGAFANATASGMPPGIYLTTSVALGDVDGDGDLDLAVGNSSWQQNRLYLNNGTGTFLDATASRMPPDNDYTTSVALGDVDGDGDLDLVIGNRNQQNRLYLNNGTGTFANATASRMPPGIYLTTSVALGDLDIDGDSDMVVGNANWQQNRLYTNLQRQLDARYLLRPGQPYSLDVYARYGPSSPFDLALPCLSTTRLVIPIPPIGILGIDPMAPLPLVQIPQPAGVGTVTWTAPSNPAFVGVEIFAQALILQPTEIRLTNVTADVILQ